MADTVNLLGHKVRKSYVIGGGVVAGALFIYEYRKQQAAKAAAAATAAASPSVNGTGDQYPPDGTTANPSDPYSTDPATGQTYGDEANGGYVGNGAANFGGGGFYGSGSGSEMPGEFTSNAYWAQYAEQLMGSSGDDPISAAIGAYIAGAPVTATQVSLVEQAIAVAGYPPVSGAGGYPPSINSGGSGAASAVSVPDVVGQPAASAQSVIQAAGLAYSGPPDGTVASQSPAGGTQAPAGSTVSVTVTGSPGGVPGGGTSTVSNGRIVSLGNNDAVIAWTPHGPATSWAVTRTGPGGTVTNHVSVPTAVYSGLAAGHNYEIRIQPLPSGTAGKIDFKTTGK